MIFRKIFMLFFVILMFHSALAVADENRPADAKSAAKAAAAAAKDDAKDEASGKITASLNRESAYVGDIVVLTLKFRLPEDASPVSEPKIKGIEELSVVDQKTDQNELKLSILIDRTESFNIGPINLSYKDEQGIKTIIRSEKLHLEVLSNLGDKPAEAQIKPIMGIVQTTPLWKKYLPWTLGLIILILLGIGIFFWQKKRNLQYEAFMSQRPAHIIAKEEIHKLQKQKLFEKGHFKEFYFRLSEIIRQYLEATLDIPAVESTTEEIARFLKSDLERSIIPLLRESDLVKFAEMVPSTAKKDDDVRNALSYITEMTPMPTVLEQSISAKEQK